MSQAVSSNTSSCPVAPLASAVALLIAASANDNRIHSLAAAACAVTATSSAGALFQIALANDYADQLYALTKDCDESAKIVGNLVRCLYAIRRHIEAAGQDVTDPVIAAFFMPDTLTQH